MTNQLTSLAPKELEIMHILWETRGSTVQGVRDLLLGTPAYTTVQTILNILVRKGSATRVLVGRAFLYRAQIAREAFQLRALKDFTQRTFQGSYPGLMKVISENNLLDTD